MVIEVIFGLTGTIAAIIGSVYVFYLLDKQHWGKNRLNKKH
ncbi:hypothetical protein FHS10_002531 [Mucilaginibacter dorajii]|nr:hypothetical protein [Mucilaginibacter dorajii]